MVHAEGEWKKRSMRGTSSSSQRRRVASMHSKQSSPRCQPIFLRVSSLSCISALGGACFPTCSRQKLGSSGACVRPRNYYQGTIYVAPPDRHMLLHGDHLLLSAGPKENFTRRRPTRFSVLPRSIMAPARSAWCSPAIWTTAQQDSRPFTPAAVSRSFRILQRASRRTCPRLPSKGVPADVVAPVEHIGAAIIRALTDRSTEGFRHGRKGTRRD